MESTLSVLRQENESVQESESVLRQALRDYTRGKFKLSRNLSRNSHFDDGRLSITQVF